MTSPEQISRWQSAAPFAVSFLLVPLIWYSALHGGWAVLLTPVATWAAC